ncbi:efflux RND transporter periplasmic adaptor subunit [uncultured Chitinophaga sp.]|uniref:efflux RND transporter periplasmic adaptor subunit n=1 Tax=uncultured Chitinophaga sp. TaxID=339340 RepID=UPI0025E294FF|nr:efflux RND transporter periplasmic adaptor subunit [uncultured Chitinophaga sp.]
MNTKLKYILIITITLGTTSLIVACGNKKPATETAEEGHEENENIVEVSSAQQQAIDVKLGTAEMKVISGLLKVNGYIDVPPQNLVSITTQMGGIVKSTPLLQGSTVKKGQVIAVLENQDYVQLQQDYLESRSQLELTSAEYERQQTLSAQNVNSQKTLQQAKAQYQVAQARESALRQRLQLININASQLTPSNIRSQVNIYSAVNGYVTKVNVNGGKFVNPNDVMFEIVDGTDLHVELNVFEKDAASVKPGQRVRFTMAGESKEQIAKVELVGREIRPDKTVTVHAIATSSANFLPGTYLKALIETGETMTLALPESAIVDYSGKKYIFVATEAPEHEHKDGAVHVHTEGDEATHQMYYYELVEITTGNADAGYVQVTLPENKKYDGKIVLSGTYDLLSKLKNSEEHAGH